MSLTVKETLKCDKCSQEIELSQRIEQGWGQVKLMIEMPFEAHSQRFDVCKNCLGLMNPEKMPLKKPLVWWLLTQSFSNVRFRFTLMVRMVWMRFRSSQRKAQRV